MSGPAQVGEIIVAEAEGEIDGAVAYFGPDAQKQSSSGLSGPSCACLLLLPLFVDSASVGR